MKNIEKYYDNTESCSPRKNVKYFVEEIKEKSEKAIELGCGEGNDTVYLIKNNWKVLAIDREDVEERIRKRLKKEEVEGFRFQKQDFENVTLEENKDMVFLDKQQVIELFKDFEIVRFKEIEKDALTGIGKMKHWHIFDIIARKRK